MKVSHFERGKGRIKLKPTLVHIKSIKLETFFRMISDTLKVKVVRFYFDPSYDYCDKSRFVGLIVVVCGQTRQVRTIDLSRQHWHQISQN